MRVSEINVRATMPHSPEAEKAVIGCCLLNAKDCVPEAQHALPSEDMLYTVAARTVWPVVMHYQDRAELIVVRQSLEDKGLLSPGLESWLLECEGTVHSVAHLPVWLEEVREKYFLRKAIESARSLIEKAQSANGNASKVIAEFQAQVLALNQPGLAGQDIQALAAEAIGRLQDVYGKGGITGVSTGLADLDAVTDGLHPGEVIVVAALTSRGKTALAMNILCHNYALPSAFFSCEMQPARLAMRAILSGAKVSMGDVRGGKLFTDDFPRILSATNALSGSKLKIENSSGWTVDQLTAKARQLKQRHGLVLVAVDYIQLLRSPEADGREQEVSAVSKGIKAMAMQLDVPVLALSQVNDEGKLRESRAIGQDADSVWILEDAGERAQDVQEVTLHVDKNREGPAGVKVPLMFFKKWTKFACKEREAQS